MAAEVGAGLVGGGMGLSDEECELMGSKGVAASGAMIYFVLGV